MTLFVNGQSVKVADVNTVAPSMVGFSGTYENGFVVNSVGGYAGPYDDDELEDDSFTYSED